jgi:SAM-dependent methyltransferase
MTQQVFSEYARYYDLLYGDKDYSAEAEYVVRLISRFQPKGRRILELGSGTGKHALLFAKNGYAVQGIERSEEMLLRARVLADQEQISLQKEGKATPEFTPGDIRVARLGRHFEIVLSLFHVISYQTAYDDILATFKTARAHLEDNGVFIFDAWYGPAVLNLRPSIRVKRMSSPDVEVTRIAEPNVLEACNRVDVNYDVFIRDKSNGRITELKETHCMRYFFMEELKILLAQSGFGLRHSEEWLSGRPSGLETWGVCFVANTAL